ncbi:hypothetical protein D3C86_991440 [compost metagenome]
MARHSGVSRGLEGLVVADLTEHDDVGVLAQDGAQGAGEGEVDLGVDADLGDAFHRVLDGVLDGDDRVGLAVELLQGGIEGGGLTGARGAGDQDDARGAVKQAIDELGVVLLEAEAFHAERDGFLAQQAQDQLLAPVGGDAGDAEVHLLAVREGGAEAAVLRAALLGDVHVAQDFEAGGDGVLDGLGNVQVLAEDAVDPEADLHEGLAGLEVDIADPALDGLGEHGVDELDDGGVGIAAGRDLLDLALGLAGLMGPGLDGPLDGAGIAAVAAIVEGDERSLEVLLAEGQGHHEVARQEGEVIEKLGVVRAVHCDDQAPSHLHQRDDEVLTREGLGDHGENRRVDREVGERRFVGQDLLEVEDLLKLLGGDVALGDQDLAELLARLHLEGERLGELELGDEAEVLEPLADPQLLDRAVLGLTALDLVGRNQGLLVAFHGLILRSAARASRGSGRPGRPACPGGREGRPRLGYRVLERCGAQGRG